MPDAPAKPAIERTQQAEPLRGWKAASLKFANGRYLFGPLTGKAPYASEEAWARCENGYSYNYSYGSVLGRDPYGPPPHYEGPVLKCSCGFYAWKDRAKVEAQMGLAVLEVDLYGTVIEHEQGYRAGKQRVLSAAVQGRCFYCSKDSDVAGLIGEGVPLVSASICPLCITHAAEARVTIERDELGTLLGTEVQWR